MRKILSLRRDIPHLNFMFIESARGPFDHTEVH